MHGPLTYYRTSKLRFEEEKGDDIMILLATSCLTSTAAQLPSSLHPDLPVLFMWGTLDPVAIPSQIERARSFIPKLQNIPLQGKGHWIMVEAREEVTNGVLDWLRAHGIVPTRPRL